MAHSVPFERLTFIAGADLSDAQYLAVKLDTNGQVVLAGAGELAIGILMTPEETGRPVTVQMSGVAEAVFGGSVTAGDRLAVDANGKLVTAAAAQSVVGLALEAGAAGERRPVLLMQSPYIEDEDEE